MKQALTRGQAFPMDEEEEFDFYTLIGLPKPAHLQEARAHSSSSFSDESSLFSPSTISSDSPSIASADSPPKISFDEEDIQEAFAITSADNPEKCSVCGEKAGKHSYYGGRVCPSCRAFFRRAVQSKYYEIFFCVRGEKCTVNLQTRRSCQFCRFKKCLASGMRTAWVLPEGERHKRFNKLSKTQYRNGLTSITDPTSESKSLKPVQPTVKLVLEPNLNQLTMDEAILIGQLVRDIQQGMTFALVHYKGFYCKVAKLAFCNQPFPNEVFENFKRLCYECQISFMSALVDFTLIPQDDQNQLIHANIPLLHSFKEACFVDESEVGFNVGLKKVAETEEFLDMEDMRGCLEKVKLCTKNDDPKPVIKYNQLYVSPWTPSYVEEVKHRELTSKMKRWTYINGKPDEVLVALGTIIIVFNPDFLELKNRPQVEQIQLKYLNLLRNYLNSRLKGKHEATAKFVEAVRLSSYARESSEILSRRLPI